MSKIPYFHIKKYFWHLFHVFFYLILSQKGEKVSSRCKRALCLANKLKLRFFKEIFNKAYLREKYHKSTIISNWDYNNNRKQEKKVGFFMFYPYPEDAWIRICFTVRKCHDVIRMLPGVDMILLTALPAGAPPQCCPPPSRDGRWQLRAAGGAACPTTWPWRRWRCSPWRIWPPPAWAGIPVTN